MEDIMLILSDLSQSVYKTSLGRLSWLVQGLLAITGRVTMRGIFRLVGLNEGINLKTAVNCRF